MAEGTSKVNLCPKCGKSLEWLGDVEDRGEKQYCQCPPPTHQPLYGWVCPVCGGGVSPMAFRCPCTPYVSAGITYNPISHG